MIRRTLGIMVGLSLVGIPVAVLADEPAGEEVIVVEEEEEMVAPAQAPVTAPPPPFVELESTSIGAGIGMSWGEGTLLVEGTPHAFRVRSLSLGDVGAAVLAAEGEVSNLENVADFEGRYVAVGAGAAAGVGASAVTMRNQHGVVITLRSELKGAQLQLGAEGFDIRFE